MLVAANERSADPGVKENNGLSVSARAVMAELIARHAATQRQLCAGVALSKPTVSLALQELQAADLVAATGRTQGPVGRSAAVHSLSSTAGWVLGVDIGATHITGTAHTLDGRILDGFHWEVAGPGRTRWADALGESAVALRAFIGGVTSGHGALRAAGIAVPTVVPSGEEPTGPSARPTGAASPSDVVAAALSLADRVPLVIENNVKCAAVAELHEGAGRGRSGFVYLQIGVKIGLGVVVGGQLIHGSNAAAGEVALLPYPWGPASRPRRGALEEYLGSAGLLRRARRAWGSGAPPDDAATLFKEAAAGNVIAARLVARHARDIGNLIAAVAAILDPGLVILGGGVGANPILLPKVREAVARLVDGTEVAITELGDQATVAGAAYLATNLALRELLG